MFELFSRRRFLTLTSLAIPTMAINMDAQAPSTTVSVPPKSGTSTGVPAIREQFPTQPPELVREMVTVAHFSLKRVKELVEARPSLARAAWDWGFGDWENALGAASHTGNRAIAEYLIANGARPSLFSATMLGQLDVVKAFVAAQPGVQKISGPHSISLLAHARAGGDAARPVFEFLQALGDADTPTAAPLSDQDRASILGTYIFGAGLTEQVEVSQDKGFLMWTRKGHVGRGLSHLGDRVFHPAGAAAVRIRFAEENGAIVMTVSDPDVVLVARKQKESNSGSPAGL